MNKDKYIPSSPYFFRIIIIAMVATILGIVALAVIFPAPLQEAVEPFNVPNPSKSAWFLLWMQEIVSHSVNFVYLIVGLFLCFIFLPFFVKNPPECAKWFDKKYRGIHIFALLVFLFIVTLTVIGVWFRGEYWEFGLWLK